VFGDAGVSIRSVWQEGVDTEASLIIVTHRAPEGEQRRAVGALANLTEVIDVSSVIRVLGDA
jgi:homoserine dehydrogenase